MKYFIGEMQLGEYPSVLLMFLYEYNDSLSINLAKYSQYKTWGKYTIFVFESRNEL